MFGRMNFVAALELNKGEVDSVSPLFRDIIIIIIINIIVVVVVVSPSTLT